MSKKDFDKCVDDYAEKFGEAFPVRMVASPEEAMEIMKKCLETGLPYNPYKSKSFDPKADY